MKNKETKKIPLLEQEEFQELLKWVRTIPDTYVDLEIGTCIKAKKLGKAQEIIDYIRENSPSSSELLLFCSDLDPDCPKPFEDIHGENKG